MKIENDQEVLFKIETKRIFGRRLGMEGVK